MATTILAPSHLNGVTTLPTASAPDAITGQVMTISPAMAADLLKNRPANRPVSKSRVRLMIEDMRAGRWRLNGEPVILTESLAVIDGQHRLFACLESGIPLVTMVVVGVVPDAAMSIDQGRARSAGDVLHMAGLEQAPQLAATARWVWKYHHGGMRCPSVVLKNHELPAFVAHHSGLHTALSWGRSLRNVLPPSAGSMLFYLMSNRDPVLAKSFFAGLATGAELKPTDGAYLLRERWLKRKERLTYAVVVARAATTVLFWNCLRRGRTCPASLSWHGAGNKDAGFPVVG